MISYKMIDNEDDLKQYLERLKSNKIEILALDLEGDQGSIRYRYSISLIQCFDGKDAVVIDVLKIGNSFWLKELLNNESITKIMFSCTNDLYMAQNVLGYTIKPVRDIAIAQKCLGMKINLSDYIGIDKTVKDSFQRANWLTRPLKEELIQYAVNDVTLLISIEEELIRTLKEKNSYDKYLKESSRLGILNYKVNQLEQYRNKFPGYKRLQPEKKKLAKRLWVFREFLGEYLDQPVGYLINKDSLRNCLTPNVDPVIQLEKELNQRRSHEKKIALSTIRSIYDKAVNYAEEIVHPIKG